MKQNINPNVQRFRTVEWNGQTQGTSEKVYTEQLGDRQMLVLRCGPRPIENTVRRYLNLCFYPGWVGDIISRVLWGQSKGTLVSSCV